MKRKLMAAFLILVLHAGAFVRVYADGAEENETTSPEITVIANMSASALSGKADILDALDTYAAASFWSPSLNVASVTAVTSFPGFPFDPMEGIRCLNVVSEDTDASAWRYISYDPAGPVDLSGYNTFFFAINIPYLSAGTTKAVLLLYNREGNVYHAETELKVETWTGVFADISQLEERSEITRIRIGVQHQFGQAVNYAYNFQIDCLAASADRYLARSVLFLSGDYLVYGGESSLSFWNDPMKLSISIASTPASKCFIESKILGKELLTLANSVRVRLQNLSPCTSVTMEYSTPSSPVYTDNEPVTVNISGGSMIVPYYFPLPAGEVNQVKFTFNGASEGDIHIYSITPVSFYSPLDGENASLSKTFGTVTGCKLTDEGRKIVISGTVTEAGIRQYTDARIELYDLDSWQNNETVFDIETKPIAATGIAPQFSFEITSSEKSRNRINSKFIAVIYNKDKQQSVMLDSPCYVTNPEIFASSSLSGADIPIKGMIGNASVLAKAGVSQTAVGLNIGEMFAGHENATVHTFEGTDYFFNTEYIKALDSQLNDYYIAGVSPVFVMTLTGIVKSAYAAPLIHKDVVVRSLSDSYAFNVNSAESVASLRAVCDFIARRYMEGSGRKKVRGITVGSDIDAAYLNYNMGKKSLAAFADHYSRAFRIIYNTIRSIDPNSFVYISVGNSWDKCFADDPSYSYSGRDLVDVISEQLRREGNIAWHLAVNPYPPASGGLTDWTDSSEIYGSISAANIASVCAYLKRDRFLYENSPRRILLISYGFYSTEPDPERLAAEYIAAYYTASSDSCAAVNGFIIGNSSVYSLSKNNFYDALKYIDTDRAAEFTGFAKEILEIGDWKEIIPSYRAGANARRLLFENSVFDALPASVTGTVILSGFEDPAILKHWTAASTLVSMSAPNDFKGYRNMLFAEYGPMTVDSLCEITHFFEYKRDLSFAPYLSFTVYTDQIDGPVLRTVTLTVTVSSGSAVIESKGTLRVGMWHDIVCDLSSFSAIKNVDRISLRITSPSDADLSGIRLVLGEMYVSSLRHDNTFLENKFREEREKYLSANNPGMNKLFIWILVGIILTALGIELINITNRLKIIRETDKRNEKKHRKKFH